MFDVLVRRKTDDHLLLASLWITAFGKFLPGARLDCSSEAGLLCSFAIRLRVEDVPHDKMFWVDG